MQRGIIGVTSDDGDRLTTVEPYHETAEEYGRTLHAAIDPHEQQTLTGDVTFVEGLALKERIDDDTKWIYDPDKQSIESKSVRTKVQQTSKFVAVPATDGHDGFGMVTSSDGVFALRILGHADFSPMDRATINLGDFYFDHEDDFSVQTGGGSSDYADTIMAWGDKIEDDTSIDRAFAQAARSNTLPQLAGEYTCDLLTESMRVNLAASGYVEVWEPELSKFQFLRWVRAEILPYVEGVDDEAADKSDRAAADEDQPSLSAFDTDDAEDGDDDADDDSGDDSGTLDWTEGTCDQCGHDRSKTRDVDGDTWCIICLEERNRENKSTGFENLDTVNMTDGGQDDA